MKEYSGFGQRGTALILTPTAGGRYTLSNLGGHLSDVLAVLPVGTVRVDKVQRAFTVPAKALRAAIAAGRLKFGHVLVLDPPVRKAAGLGVRLVPARVFSTGKVIEYTIL